MFVKTNEWTIFKVSQKLQVISVIPAKQQAGLTLALLLCTRSLQFTTKAASLWWGGGSPHHGGWHGSLCPVAGLPYGCQWETAGPLCHREVLPESEVFALLQKATPTACGLCPETLPPEIIKHKRWNLSAAKVLAIGVCQGKGLGLNSSGHHRNLMALSKSHKGYLLFVDLWQQTEFIISLIQINTKIL